MNMKFLNLEPSEQHTPETPTFKNQTYSQVVDLVKELKLVWNPDNRQYINDFLNIRNTLDVYVVGKYIYCKKSN